MSFVFVITREPRTRAAMTDYLRERGYDTGTAESYDVAMEELPMKRPDALVVDVQGVPRGEVGTTFTTFNQWMSSIYQHAAAPTIIYLLHKGARRPHFRLDGPVIKKPFAYESLGEVLRERLGHPRRNGAGPGSDLDLATNTLKSEQGETHLTHIEANLLAYLMEHEGGSCTRESCWWTCGSTTTRPGPARWCEPSEQPPAEAPRGDGDVGLHPDDPGQGYRFTA
jgi:DNA-binding response OmpR family regulator